MIRRTKLKGYRVTKTSSGKTVVEPIPFYGMDASRKIAAKKGSKVKVCRKLPT